MQAFPHRYFVSSAATATGDLAVSADRVPTLSCAPPVEFDGPGDRWSPETLFVAALAGCYLLTFRAVANVGKLRWLRIACDVQGVVDRVNMVTQFTEITLLVRLELPQGCDIAHARRLLERAEHACLVTNSVKAATRLEAEVVVRLQGAA
jgi:organic hydroperoxide reductase OsmC/OhrA